MKKKYEDIAEYFLNRKKPAEILSAEILSTYPNPPLELPSYYADINREYSNVIIPTLDFDILAMIFSLVHMMMYLNV